MRLIKLVEGGPDVSLETEKGTINLVPGMTVEVDDEQAERLLGTTPPLFVPATPSAYPLAGKGDPAPAPATSTPRKRKVNVAKGG